MQELLKKKSDRLPFNGEFLLYLSFL